MKSHLLTSRSSRLAKQLTTASWSAPGSVTLDGSTRPSQHWFVPTLPGDIVAVGSVAILVFAGLLKTELFWLPLDLTVLAATAVTLSVGWFVLTNQFHVRLPLPALLVIGTCLPATLYVATTSEALVKRAGLLITILVVIGCGTLVRTYRRQQLWTLFHLAAGVALVGTGSLNEVGRLSGTGTTVAAGRASGVAVVVLLCLALSGGVRRPLMILACLGITTWLVLGLISTGSRGPVFACAAATLLVAVFAPGRGRYVRILAGIGAFGTGWLTLSEATGIGATRITNYVGGKYGLTGARGGLWEPTLGAIPAHPFGVGWGEFWHVLPAGALLDSGYRQYPHNVLLEVTIEVGWLAGATVAAFIIASLVKLRQGADHPCGAVLLGIAIFTVLNAMVSGDVNDNRVMWAALTVAWVQARPDDEAHRTAASPKPGLSLRRVQRSTDRRPDDNSIQHEKEPRQDGRREPVVGPVVQAR